MGKTIAEKILSRKSGTDANCTQYIFSASSRASCTLDRSSSMILAPSRDVLLMAEYFSLGRSGKIPMVMADSRSECAVKAPDK